MDETSIKQKIEKLKRNLSYHNRDEYNAIKKIYELILICIKTKNLEDIFYVFKYSEFGLIYFISTIDIL